MTKHDLEARIAKLEAIEAIKNTMHAYCKACDNDYDPPAIAALYAPDGIGDYGAGVAVGREAIAARFKETHKRIPFAAHLVMNEMISVDGDKAHGEWWILQPRTHLVDGKMVGAWMVGNYDIDFVQLDGDWKFARLRVRDKFTTAHLSDWAEASLASRKKA